MNHRRWKIETFGNDEAVTTFQIAESDHLLLVMIDWDRRPSAEHVALARRAIDGARSDAPSSFASEAISRLHDELCQASWIARDFGVAAGSLAVTSLGAQVAWVGDVRVEVTDGGKLWTSTDHTLQNDAALKGQPIPASLADTAPSILVRAVGPISALDVERRDFASQAIDGVALSSKGLHHHDPSDHRSWQPPRPDRIGDGVAILYISAIRAAAAPLR